VAASSRHRSRGHRDQPPDEEYRTRAACDRRCVPVRALIPLLSTDDTWKLTAGDIGPFRLTDAEAVSMARFLVQRNGQFLGSSSAVNLVGCVKLARKMGWCNGEKIVTVL